jgi:hypothetical protein
MGVYKLSANSVSNGRTIYGSMLAGNTAFVPYVLPTSYESIATTTVGSGGSSSVDFTSIPSTYTHLQIRFINLQDSAQNVWLRFNSDSANNYDWHELFGDGSGAFSGSLTSQNHIKIGYVGTTTTSYAGASITDILDYTNTNKNTTVRSLSGSDINGSGGYLLFRSGLWRNTNAITSITILPASGNFKQYSSFALYGVKGA